MLPAEFMFAGLTVAGFTRMSQQAVSNPSFGGNITHLDLSCLALESLEVMEAAAAAAAASGGGLPPIGSTVSLAAAAAAAAAAASSSSSQSVVPEQLAAAAAVGPSVQPYPLLFPESWCKRLTSLSLDWVKADGQSLQNPLQQTLNLCSNLTRLSLVGYQGSVDNLLSSVAAAGANLMHLNLQHSQVSDAGLAAVAAAFPKLQSLYLSYCRNVGDQGLQQLLGMSQLAELDLFNTPCVSAGAVASIARWAQLELVES